MVLFTQLVCSTCRKILTYPLGAVSCRCRNCQTVNATVHMEILCSCCHTTLLMPSNTLTVLCPCCATVTDIAIDLLPQVPEPVSLDGEDEKSAKTIYVEVPNAGNMRPLQAPPSTGGGEGAPPAATPVRQQPQILVATKIL